MSAATSTILTGIGIAASTGVGLASGLSGKGGSSQSNALIQSQADASKFGVGQSKIDLPKARQTLELPLQYWSRILSGGRYEALEGLAPEVSTITAQYDTALRNAAELTPRSGARSALLEEMRFKRAADITKTLLGARPRAADALTNIGSTFAQMGTSELGAGTGAGASAMSGSLAQDRSRAEQNAALGEGIGSLIAMLINKIPTKSSSSGMM